MKPHREPTRCSNCGAARWELAPQRVTRPDGAIVWPRTCLACTRPGPDHVDDTRAPNIWTRARHLKEDR